MDKVKFYLKIILDYSSINRDKVTIITVVITLCRIMNIIYY